MLSAIIAYSDRLPLNAKCSECGYILGEATELRGQYFRNLLRETVRSLRLSRVDEVIVVNYGNQLYPRIKVAESLVINEAASGAFSEWDAKAIGVKAASHDLIITVNADIRVTPEVVRWFVEAVKQDRTCLYQGTKGWLSEEQSLLFLRTGCFDACYHEALVDITQGGENPVEGIEPASWAARRPAAAMYLREYGIDLWKHSGDFQAFHRQILRRVEYPIGSTGWGWGDIEFRLRFREAGLKEQWNRSHPVWHMFHPFRSWEERAAECKFNMSIWGRSIDFSAGGSRWVLPPTEPKADALQHSGTLCRLRRDED